MADNLAVTAGSGSTIGMDEVVDGTLGTVKVGFGKIMDGTLDSTNKLVVNGSGEAKVKATDTDALLTTIDADTGAIATSVASIDTDTTTIIGHLDGVETLLTDIEADTDTLAVVGGGAEATALRVTIANDSTGVVSVDDNGGSLTVDGTVTAAAQPGVDIGDVTVNNASGASAVNIQDGGNSITVDGTITETNSGSALTSLQLLDDVIFTDDAAFTVGTSKVNAVGYLADETSTDSVDEGDVGAPRMTANRQQIVTIRPNANGEGLDVFRTLDADETEEEVKASAGKIYGWYMYNDGSAEVYVKFYNATAANTTVGTTTPRLTIPLPAGSAANVEFTNGIVFDTAICIAATTAVGDSDTTAPAANQVVANIFYK